MAAAGINAADLLQRKGLYPAPPGYPPDIPGMEFAGEVVGLGTGCRPASPSGTGSCPSPAAGPRPSWPWCPRTSPCPCPTASPGTRPAGSPRRSAPPMTPCSPRLTWRRRTGPHLGRRRRGGHRRRAAGPCRRRPRGGVGSFAWRITRGPRPRCRPGHRARPGSRPRSLRRVARAGGCAGRRRRAARPGHGRAGGGDRGRGRGQGRAQPAGPDGPAGDHRRVDPAGPEHGGEGGRGPCASGSERSPCSARGTIGVPVVERFPMARAAEAYERFAAGGKFGKIVLVTDRAWRPGCGRR